MGRKSYLAGVLRRIGPRPPRSPQDSYRENWSASGLPEREVLELLQLIERIYGVPAGVLRPDDSIELLTGSVPSRAWWRDHFHDLHAGEVAASLGDELSRKLDAHGLATIEAIKTIDDLVKAWCGRVPPA